MYIATYNVVRMPPVPLTAVYREDLLYVPFMLEPRSVLMSDAPSILPARRWWALLTRAR